MSISRAFAAAREIAFSKFAGRLRKAANNGAYLVVYRAHGVGGLRLAVSLDVSRDRE